MKICTKYVVGLVLFAAWAVALYTSHLALSTLILAALVVYLGMLAFSYEHKKSQPRSNVELTPQLAEE